MADESEYKKRAGITESDIKKYTLEAKQEAKTRELFLDPKFYVPYDFKVTDGFYEMDEMQNELLKDYIKQDRRFRRAYARNFTPTFVRYLVSKVRLREPTRISIIGNQRGGKSSVAIGIQGFLNALYLRKTTIDYICQNAYEFLERLQFMRMEQLLNSCFVIDEEKQSIYGIGSVAKKIKLTDVQNIIAMQNISTIMLNPTKWADNTAEYGLKIFGRNFKTRTCRAMLYNLQESSSFALPMGMIYLPIYNVVLPYWQELEKDYLIKKKEWIVAEQRGEGDVLAKVRHELAKKFSQDSNYLSLKKKKERIIYITTVLGSEYTQTEIEGIETLTGILMQGIEIPQQEELNRINPDEEEEVSEEDVEER